MILTGAISDALRATLGLGPGRFALAVLLATLVVGPVAVVVRAAEDTDRMPAALVVAWLRCSAIVGGGLLGALLLGGLTQGFAPEGILASTGALALVLLADAHVERRPGR